MDNLFDLSGKVIAVTGGAGLLGKEIVKALGAYSAKVYIADISEELGKNIENELAGYGDILFMKLDITSETSVIKFIENVIDREGKIDVWINNAYPRTSDWGKKVEDIPLESWKLNIDMHLNGYYLCCQKIAEVMKNQGFGSVINFSSIYGIVGPDFSIYEGTEMTMPAAYSAIKGAIVNFTRYMAAYYGKYNIRFNCISPGGIYDNQPETFVNKYSEKTPLKRMGDKKDIIGGIIYLASDSSSFVTGHNLIIDGGWTCI